MEVVRSAAAEGGRENWATCTFVGARAARCAIALRRAPRSLRTSLAQVLINHQSLSLQDTAILRESAITYINNGLNRKCGGENYQNHLPKQIKKYKRWK